MLRLFFGNQSYAMLAAPLLAAAYAILNFFTQTFKPSSANELDLGLWGIVSFNPGIIGSIVSVVLVTVSAILLNMIFNRNEFFDRNTFLPVLLYITASSFFPHFYNFDGFGLSLFIVSLSFWSFFKINQNDDARKAMFNGTILWSLASTFFPMLFLVFPFLFIILWVFRPFKFRESLMIILGTITPLLYVLSYYLITKNYAPNFSMSSSAPHVGQVTVIAVTSGIFLFGMLSMKSVLRNVQQGSIRLRKLNTMILWFIFTFAAITTLDFLFFKHTGSAALLLIPLMFIIPYAFGQKRLRNETAVLYYCFLLTSVSNFFISILF